MFLKILCRLSIYSRHLILCLCLPSDLTSHYNPLNSLHSSNFGLNSFCEYSKLISDSETLSVKWSFYLECPSSRSFSVFFSHSLNLSPNILTSFLRLMLHLISCYFVSWSIYLFKLVNIMSYHVIICLNITQFIVSFSRIRTVLYESFIFL